jgi:hypothetical protein
LPFIADVLAKEAVLGKFPHTVERALVRYTQLNPIRVQSVSSIVKLWRYHCY